MKRCEHGPEPSCNNRIVSKRRVSSRSSGNLTAALIYSLAHQTDRRFLQSSGSYSRDIREGAGGVIIPSIHPKLTSGDGVLRPRRLLLPPVRLRSSKTWDLHRRTESASSSAKQDLPGCFSLHRHTRRIHWRYIQQVQMKKHWPRGIGDSVCLVTNYERRVQVFDKADAAGSSIPATRGSTLWTQTRTPRPALRFDVPLCENRDCMNYYQRPKTFDCS